MSLHAFWKSNCKGNYIKPGVAGCASPHSSENSPNTLTSLFDSVPSRTFVYKGCGENLSLNPANSLIPWQLREFAFSPWFRFVFRFSFACDAPKSPENVRFLFALFAFYSLLCRFSFAPPGIFPQVDAKFGVFHRHDGHREVFHRAEFDMPERNCHLLSVFQVRFLFAPPGRSR